MLELIILHSCAHTCMHHAQRCTRLCTEVYQAMHKGVPYQTLVAGTRKVWHHSVPGRRVSSEQSTHSLASQWPCCRRVESETLWHSERKAEIGLHIYICTHSKCVICITLGIHTYLYTPCKPTYTPCIHTYTPYTDMGHFTGNRTTLKPSPSPSHILAQLSIYILPFKLHLIAVYLYTPSYLVYKMQPFE